ncbi:hypothetical protein [Acidimangrovimonas pyrenivorans]|uniref:DUF3329 domain-containing protein n=1 Tax=Acidimangrovimonas pyrenivorans TaxID=2030798 RepID=A0ABV7AIY5_9RHOB
MKLLDPNDPFFRPAWRRWATAGVPGLWACVEAWSGSKTWALVFAAIAVFAYWQLILKGPDDEAK